MIDMQCIDGDEWVWHYRPLRCDVAMYGGRAEAEGNL